MPSGAQRIAGVLLRVSPCANVAMHHGTARSQRTTRQFESAMQSDSTPLRVSSTQARRIRQQQAECWAPSAVPLECSGTLIGAQSMMSLLSPLHAIAAQRGEGLRPELVRLLERSKPPVGTREGQE